MSSYAAQLNLHEDLPDALDAYRGQWVEYGVLERAYALAQPEKFAEIVGHYGHTAIEAKRYTASSFIARTLGELSRTGAVLFHAGPATGRWNYLSQVSWWALDPEPQWLPGNQLSWADAGHDTTYVPGNVEN